MFQFPASLFFSEFSCEKVVQFGNLGLKDRMRLPRAYRSLPRPSSMFKPSYPSISLVIQFFQIEVDQNIQNQYKLFLSLQLFLVKGLLFPLTEIIHFCPFNIFMLKSIWELFPSCLLHWIYLSLISQINDSPSADTEIDISVSPTLASWRFFSSSLNFTFGEYDVWFVINF